MFKSILCPVDGSEQSRQALDVAAELAKEQSAMLTICVVVNPSKASAMAFGDPAMSAACFDALDQEGRSLVRETVEAIAQVVPVNGVCLDGETVQSIVAYAAQQGCDLIVMGSHGRSGIQRALIGSVAEGVVRHAAVPVMVVRSPRKQTVQTAVSKPAKAAVTA